MSHLTAFFLACSLWLGAAPAAANDGVAPESTWPASPWGGMQLAQAQPKLGSKEYSDEMRRRMQRKPAAQAQTEQARREAYQKFNMEAWERAKYKNKQPKKQVAQQPAQRTTATKPKTRQMGEERVDKALSPTELDLYEQIKGELTNRARGIQGQELPLIKKQGNRPVSEAEHRSVEQPPALLGSRDQGKNAKSNIDPEKLKSVPSITKEMVKKLEEEVKPKQAKVISGLENKKNRAQKEVQSLNKKLDDLRKKNALPPYGNEKASYFVRNDEEQLVKKLADAQDIVVELGHGLDRDRRSDREDIRKLHALEKAREDVKKKQEELDDFRKKEWAYLEKHNKKSLSVPKIVYSMIPIKNKKENFATSTPMKISQEKTLLQEIADAQNKVMELEHGLGRERFSDRLQIKNLPRIEPEEPQLR